MRRDVIAPCALAIRTALFALALAASAPGAAYTVYVSSEKDNTITVVDGEAGSPDARG